MKNVKTIQNLVSSDFKQKFGFIYVGLKLKFKITEIVFQYLRTNF